ncbi:MAG TPA: peptidylprolyl isomerase [Burkholderiaceae bacterium]|nr:peptidylprolyl isomerase [Burkholderiaceae bacterium]
MNTQPYAESLVSSSTNQNQIMSAKVNNIDLQAAGEIVPIEELRQRAYSELLRQTAIREGLLQADDTYSRDGILSEQASNAIESLLDTNINVPEPSIDACKRYHAAHQAQYSTGERVMVRHILFAVTEGVDFSALRQKAEVTLLNVRCHNDDSDEESFTNMAQKYSNCPSGAEGGNLGWLSFEDCAPEFGKEIFGQSDVGVLPRLVHSRHGLHIVEVIHREPGIAQSFEMVSGAVTLALRQQSYITALRQYLSLLAKDAVITGVDLDAADSISV